MGKINLDAYFMKNDQKTQVRVCNSLEDIAEAEEVNRHMREVVRDYRYRALKSRQLACRLILDRNR